MTDYDGPERRSQASQHDQARVMVGDLVETIRSVVREEFTAAAKDGRLLSDTDQHDLRDWLKLRKTQAEMRRKLLGNTIGWVIIVVVGGLGLAVWEAIKYRIGQS